MTYWLRRMPLLLRRVIALLLPLVLLGFIWSTLAMPLIELHQNSRAGIGQLKAHIVLDKALIASGPKIRARLTKLQFDMPATTGDFRSDSDTAAVADLQTKVQGFVVQDGGSVQSVEPLPSVPAGDFDTISVEMSFSVPLQTFPGLLRQLETNKPDIFIATAAIQTADGSTLNGGTTAPDQQLSINWTVVAYRRAGIVQ